MKTSTRIHTLGICAMSKKVKTKHMQKIIKNLKKFDEFKLINFSEDLIFNKEIENWPIVDSMIVFFSTGFPFNKVLDYIKLRKPFLVNDFESQKILWDRREVIKKLKENKIPTPESIIIDRGEIIDNDGDNYPEVELNTTQERIEMIEDYFNNIEDNLNNNINDYKIINKEDYELNLDKINSKWEWIISKNKNLNNNTNNNLEKNYDLDSLNSIDNKNVSSGSTNKFKLSSKKLILLNEPSTSKNSGSEEENIEIEEESYDISESINKHLKESDEYIEFHKKRLYKPFIEKPANGDDHNIYIYYPHYGGQKRLFRKTKNLSSLYYSNINKIRRDKSYIYEEFLQSDGFDIKVYTVGEDYFHAEERKAPTLDGLVQRSVEGKEVRYPVNLTQEEKNIARKIVKIFKQNICGFDILRSKGKSYVVDVNGWSFVKGNNKYYEDCAIQIRKIILSNLNKEMLLIKEIKFPEIKIYEDMVLDNNKTGEKLKSIIGVFRHADRAPKQKLKFITNEPQILNLFDKYYNDNMIRIKDGKECANDLKLKKPQELLDLYNKIIEILNKLKTKENEIENINIESDDLYIKLFQVKLILEKNLNFEGLTRKVQLRPQKWKKIIEKNKPKYIIEEALFIIKWGGKITHSGIKQARLLGKTLRKQIYSNGDKMTWEDLLRLHSTYQHDLKCYSSEEGRNLKTAAAFLQGFLQLDGSLIPIISSMVRNDEKVSKLLDASNGDIEHLRKNVKKKLEELFHYKGDLKDKYNEMLFNKDIKNEDNTEINKIKERQKPFYDLIDEIGNFEGQMNEVQQLLGQFIKHLKSFLCTEEILKECDTYYVRNSNSIKNRRNPLKKSKTLILNKEETFQKIDKKRSNSSNKTKRNLKGKEKKKYKLKEIESENNKFYLYDCEEEKIILIFKRYVKLFVEFYNTKTKKYNLGKIPEIYDNIKYDVIHNKSIINKEGFKLFQIMNKLACFYMPLEYGITIQEKYNIGIKLIKPLLKKIKNDLFWINSDNKTEDFLQENKFMNDINKNDKLVKTRFYFTSQSHLYSLFNTIIYGLNSFLVDDESKQNEVWKIFDLDYCSHIIFLLFENLNVDEKDDKRYRIEIIVSTGADKDAKFANYEHMISVNPWIVLNDHLTLKDLKYYFNYVLI